jgi:hypothetical protein
VENDLLYYICVKSNMNYNGRRGRGRHRLGWINDVEDDLFHYISVKSNMNYNG